MKIFIGNKIKTDILICLVNRLCKKGTITIEPIDHLHRTASSDHKVSGAISLPKTETK
jgi:hypothetical protein